MNESLAKILEKTKPARLVIASKYASASELKALAALKLLEFGENQVQALCQKQQELANLRLSWHFIGTLQSNKINALIRARPSLWQSCNSLKLALAVNQRLDYELDTLLELNSAAEASKSGLGLDEVVETYLQIKELCPRLRLCGVMSIGAHSDDERLVAKSFEATYRIFERLQKEGASICSMGISDDYELALKNGSNMLRLGSVIFEALRARR